MGFTPFKTDPDVWTRLAEDNSCYEYIAVYVDDPAISAKNKKKLSHDHVQVQASSQGRASPMSQKDYWISGQSSYGVIRYRIHEPDYSDLPIRNMSGQGQSTLVQEKSYHMISQNPLGNKLPPLIM